MMTEWSSFVDGTLRRSAEAVDASTGRIQRFGRLEDEYETLRRGAALVDRDYAGVLEIGGADRASWLHNLTTNQVANLGRHEGVYAFALNVQGRILFDLQVLNRGDVIWCIINRAFRERAVKHFTRYIITEDVSITDRSDDFVRLGVSGEGAPRVLASWGLKQAGAMASLSSATCTIDGASVVAVRTDFCGVTGFDLFVPCEHAVAVWSALSSDASHPHAVPIGDAVVEITRIEAGLPCPCRELVDDVLPAETGQFDRAVSYTKGCYLGQEIVERMRSRGVVARKLSGLVFLDAERPPAGATVCDDSGAVVGAVTSTCTSPAVGSAIGLAFLKTDVHEPGRRLHVRWTDDQGVEREASAQVTALPFVGVAAH